MKHGNLRGSGKILKIKSYKIESGGNFNPTIMVIAKNAHYLGKVEIDCESNLIAKLLCYKFA